MCTVTFFFFLVRTGCMEMKVLEMGTSAKDTKPYIPGNNVFAI